MPTNGSWTPSVLLTGLLLCLSISCQVSNAADDQTGSAEVSDFENEPPECKSHREVPIGHGWAVVGGDILVRGQRNGNAYSYGAGMEPIFEGTYQLWNNMKIPYT